jgi:hypothetical protein
MSNAVIAGIRSAVQYVIALGVAAGATFLLSRFGIEVDVVAATEVVFVVAFGFVVWGLNTLTVKFPVLAVILSLGRSTESPIY